MDKYGASCSSVNEEVQATEGIARENIGAGAVEIKEQPEEATGIMGRMGLSGKNISIILTVVLFSVLITVKFMFKGRE